MRVVKSFFIAFSLYSKIPVPQFAWKEEDMRYLFCFFPWVGALTGGCLYAWLSFCGWLRIGGLCRVMICAALPLLITGGIHIDGFMDTMDALHSYQPKERKLEILKDSHIGAFAVIGLAVYGLICLGALSEIESKELQKIVCGGFVLSRCLCGISAVSFPMAKGDGMLAFFSGCSDKKTVRASLYIQGAACIGLMLYWNLYAGIAVAAAAIGLTAYYFYRSRKEFGGITGDTSGWFIVLCEGCVIAAVAAADIFLR